MAAESEQTVVDGLQSEAMINLQIELNQKNKLIEELQKENINLKQFIAQQSLHLNEQNEIINSLQNKVKQLNGIRSRFCSFYLMVCG